MREDAAASRNPELQYIAGLAVNNNMETQIYNGMLTYRRFPLNLLTGSPASLSQLARGARHKSGKQP